MITERTRNVQAVKADTKEADRADSSSLTCLWGYTFMWHLMHSWPILAQLLPDIHLRLHLGHLYSPKHRFLPWYGVRPSPFGRACENHINYPNWEIHSFICILRRCRYHRMQCGDNWTIKSIIERTWVYECILASIKLWMDCKSLHIGRCY